MRKTGQTQNVADAAEAARLHRLLEINAACGDLDARTRDRFLEAIDAAEGRDTASRRATDAA